jgi:hypothetical protein
MNMSKLHCGMLMPGSSSFSALDLKGHEVHSHSHSPEALNHHVQAILYFLVKVWPSERSHAEAHVRLPTARPRRRPSSAPAEQRQLRYQKAARRDDNGRRRSLSVALGSLPSIVPLH